jgi:hypothetical protein
MREEDKIVSEWGTQNKTIRENEEETEENCIMRSFTICNHSSQNIT